ncbi:hypothetical protein [Mammaliicoccus sciuri]|uniref:hypothetical protein n=1 Tax=Mammaliicoccus sciuri TaxID=1296 RepID=UPI0008F689B7|nr:hypothetical protein [Mammaliicoccus sciuri]UTI85297.1 hypothetical protein NIT60_00310 [Mammaliicoccus sciuri]CAG7914226.1 hypothetical protein SSCS72_02023 [Mammaliicoccus sciuri]SFV43886.1 Hypothetical protein SSCIU_00677 [Mammaliicoccus sciuri]
MKFSVRKPSVKKVFKSKTTGSVKRKVKSSINPTYGTKGSGYVMSPKKAINNKIYKKSTKSFWSFFK